MSEVRVDTERVEEEWSVGNSVVAIRGALLMAQTWESSEVRKGIRLVGVTIPATPQTVDVPRPNLLTPISAPGSFIRWTRGLLRHNCH